MPIYEYQCGSCEFKLETIQKISEPPLEICPMCNSLSLKKLISASVFKLKGSGWYETDFKNSKKLPKNNQDNEKKINANTDNKHKKTKEN